MTIFINSNINILISVDWVVKTPCLFYYRSKVSLCQRNTHDASNLLANVGENFCSISAQKTTKQIFVKTDLLTIWKHRVGLESARATLCKWATRTRQTCFSKTFANSQTNRNNKKLSKTGFGYDKALFGKLTNELDTGVKSFLTELLFFYRTNTKVYAYNFPASGFYSLTVRN